MNSQKDEGESQDESINEKMAVQDSEIIKENMEESNEVNESEKETEVVKMSSVEQEEEKEVVAHISLAHGLCDLFRLPMVVKGCFGLLGRSGGIN